MVRRSSARGAFWGCATYPRCRGTRNIVAAEAPDYGPGPASVAAAPAAPVDTAANLAAALERLDAGQRAVTEWRPAAGNARVDAAAGSGKTSTICALVGVLVRDGAVAPRSLIVTTFTAKAGKELETRLAALVPAAAMAELRVGTFHSLALRTLREIDPALWRIDSCLDAGEGSRRAGIPSTISLWGAVTGWRDVPGLPGVRGLDIDDVEARDYASAHDLIRANALAGPTEQTALAAVPLPRFAEAVGLFRSAKRGLAAWDFADALASFHRRLGEGGVGAGACVLVDEAQDNSKIQLEIALRLSQGGRLILVGDARQAIYQWRGAYPALFMEADQQIGARTYSLASNYRSGRLIVETGNRVAAGKPWSLGTPAVAARDVPGDVRILPGFATPGDEADGIAEEISARLDEGAAPGDFAVLSRTNAQAGPVEAALVARRIPVVVVGGVPFFARKEVKDTLAYCTLAQRDDFDAFGRIVNKPRRYLGRAFVDDVRREVGPGRGLLDVLVMLLPRLRQNQRAGCSTLIDAIRRLRAAKWPETAQVAAGLLAPAPDPALNPTEDLASAGDEDKRGAPWTLAAIAAQFPSVEALGTFADRCAAEVHSAWGDDVPAGRVTLSTIHKAKGLEWRHVFVPCSATVFPHSRSEGNVDRTREEERLFYVAATRARDVLVFTYAEENLRGRPAGPSQFLDYVDVAPDAPPTPPATPPAPAPTTPPVTPPVTPPAPAVAAPAVEAIVWEGAESIKRKIATARLLADERTEAEPRATDGTRYVTVQSSAFGELLAPLGFVPDGVRSQPAGQVVYTASLRPGAVISVYTTVPVQGAEARPVGEDSIKVAATFDDGGETRPLLRRMPYCTRTRGWRCALLDRIDGVLGTLSAVPCRRCGAPTVARKNKAGAEFLGCVRWPACR